MQPIRREDLIVVMTNQQDQRRKLLRMVIVARNNELQIQATRAAMGKTVLTGFLSLASC